MNREVLKKNLIMMLTAAGVLLLTALACHFLGNAMAEGLNQLKSEINESRLDTEIDDVEGYGIILSGTGYLLGGLAYLVFVVFLVVIPAFFGAWTLIFTLLAWVVAVKTDSILTYRILMGFDFAGIALMILLNLFALSGGAFFMLLLIGAWGAVLFFGIRNTYTKKIRLNISETDSVDNLLKKE